MHVRAAAESLIGGFLQMSPRRRWLVAGLLLLALALLLRARHFGNPAMHVDEQFYLLVGDRMLGGALPYLDIWDRKPIGLFLLYGAIRLLGGTGVLEYQLVGTLFAAATALLVVRLATRFAPFGAALLSGIVYLLWLNIVGGEGGQSAVFYNLPMTMAAMSSPIM